MCMNYIFWTLEMIRYFAGDNPENVTRYEIIVGQTKDNAGSMIDPPSVERVSGAYWSGFPLVQGNTVAACLQCSEWTRESIVLASLFLCRWDIRTRGPTDRPPDHLTNRVSLSFSFYTHARARARYIHTYIPVHSSINFSSFSININFL